MDKGLFLILGTLLVVVGSGIRFVQKLIAQEYLAAGGYLAFVIASIALFIGYLFLRQRAMWLDRGIALLVLAGILIVVGAGILLVQAQKAQQYWATSGHGVLIVVGVAVLIGSYMIRKRRLNSQMNMFRRW